MINKLNHLYNKITSIFEIKDNIFYFNSKFYLGLKNIQTESELTSETALEILDLLDLFKNKDKGVPFYFDKVIVTNCNLQKCLINLQKQVLDITLNNKCDKLDTIKTQRDFILDSVFVLDYLISTNKFLEAQRIIDRLQMCNSICSNIISSSNNCNCGKTI